jgi:cytochrome c
MHSSRSDRIVTFVATLLCVGAAHAGDAARGKDVFKAECAECHSARDGHHKKGPSLFAVIGRPAASIEGVSYSDALKKSGWVWRERELRAYLSKPVSQSNPGGKMKYDGLADTRALDDLIAYLQTLK